MPAMQRMAPSTAAIPLEARILADQVTALQRTLPSIILGNTLTPLVVLVCVKGLVSTVALGSWFALQMLHSAFNAWAWWLTRHRPAHPRNAPARARAIIVASGLSGLLWAAGLVFLWPPERLDLQILLIFLIGGMTSSAMHALSVLLPAYYAFLVPSVASVVGMSLWAGSVAHLAVAATVLAFGLTSIRFAASLNRTLRDSLRSRYTVAELAADLQLQKERAEAASLDKSRFLAAASHDLRQPVHALSLFLSALRKQPLTVEGERLATHAAHAVETMADLFNSLLDVSRLDAGMVHPERRRFPVAPLLERVAEQEQPSAGAAGLRLRLRLPPQPLWIETDPVLLERVLRNLVSNALRYTDRGTVLIALRRGAGGWVLQVRDSGIGIPPERQADVFQEFVQLHNPERDRNKGLGLGLAIVRRTVELLGLALNLRSAPGRGTVFTLALPVVAPAGAGVTAVEQGPAAPAPDSAPPPGLFVAVIDDDADILAAMEAVLSGWGCKVLTAGDVAELLAGLLLEPATPELLISDFRLREGASGLDAVARLRDEYNQDIPAILITGDTAPERLVEAQASGLLLLHKPVATEDLRVAIAQALAQGRRADTEEAEEAAAAAEAAL
ncbi:signal transduction histidine kinase [Roseateles toxinivorans]|uniref:histidine kinase n=2 Tax=Roseateles toxinivorans TaxID=270368 RepID=A0A4V6PV32_9BURK|nr:signal transduction histidine kinase [Roseateles toxinivorans]